MPRGRHDAQPLLGDGSNWDGSKGGGGGGGGGGDDDDDDDDTMVDNPAPVETCSAELDACDLNREQHELVERVVMMLMLLLRLTTRPD